MDVGKFVNRRLVEVVAVVSDERRAGFVSGGEVQKVKFVECDILWEKPIIETPRFDCDIVCKWKNLIEDSVKLLLGPGNDIQPAVVL